MEQHWCLWNHSHQLGCYFMVFIFTGVGEIVGGGGWCECFPKTLGYFWGPWERSSICLWTIRCCSPMLFHRESRLIAQLSCNVVSGNSTILPTDTSHPCWMQKWSTVHVQRWNVLVLLWRSQSFCQVRFHLFDILRRLEFYHSYILNWAI